MEEGMALILMGGVALIALLCLIYAVVTNSD
jgi:hypothetical protein